jgi:hypothetical protein
MFFMYEKSQSHSYVTTDGQSARLSCFQASLWSSGPVFYYSQTVAGLLIGGGLSDERTVLLFAIVADASAFIYDFFLNNR